jgi:site-specific DNA recombinase
LAPRKKPSSKIRMARSQEVPSGSLVWVYLRHSPGEDQDVRSQRWKAEAWCRERGYLVERWWLDEAKTGSQVAGRDQFEAMIRSSHASPPPVRAIVIWDWGRFARDDLEAQFFSADLRLRGYELLSIHDDIPSGEFQGIFEAFTRWKNWRYLVDLQANIMRGLDARVLGEVVIDGAVRKGFSGGGFPPVGYEARKAQIGTKPSGKPQMLTYWVMTTDADLRARVAKAWQMALASAQRGEKPPIREIHRACRLYADPSAYYDMLESPTYAGVRKVGNREVADAHEAYLTVAEWELIRRTMPQGKLSPRDDHPKRVASAFLLSGITYCGYCGARIDLERQRARSDAASLRCAARKKDASACHLMKLSYAVFMDGILHIMRTEVLTEARIRRAVDELNARLSASRSDAAERRRGLMKEISAIERSIERLLDLAEAGNASAAVRARLADREAEKADKERMLAHLAAEGHAAKPLKVTDRTVRELVASLQQQLDEASEESLRRLLRTYVRRVEITNETGTVFFTVPMDALLPSSDPSKGGYGWYAWRRPTDSHELTSATFAIVRSRRR